MKALLGMVGRRGAVELHPGDIYVLKLDDKEFTVPAAELDELESLITATRSLKQLVDKAWAPGMALEAMDNGGETF